MEEEEIRISRLPTLALQVITIPAWKETTGLRALVTSTILSVARLSFAAMIVLIPFSWRVVLEARRFPPIYKDYTDFMLTASDVLMLVTLLSWIASLLLTPRRIRTGPLFIAIPLAGITGIGTLSTVVSVDPALSLYHSIRLVQLGLLYLYVVNELRSLAAIGVPVAIQVLVQSAVGLAQFLGQHSIGLTQVGELILDPSWQGVSIVWSRQSVLLRVYGLSDHPNILGGCLAFALVLLVYWYLQNRSAWRTPIAAVVGLTLVALLLTFSRAAWLALFVGFAFFLFLLFRLRRQDAIHDVLGLAAAGLILVLPFVWQYSGYLGVRLNPTEPSTATGDNRSIAERDALSRAADGIFVGHPVLGIGLGAFPLALRAAKPSFAFDYQPAHFALLEVAAETGILGALFYAILLFAPFAAVGVNWHRLRAEPNVLAVVASSSLLLAIMTVGLFDYYTWILTPGRLWQWMGWGLWAATYSDWIQAKHG